MIRTGGRWDPTASPIYFLASNVWGQHRVSEVTQNQLIAVNELEGKADQAHLETWIKRGRSILLDSGIFNLASEHARAHKVSHDVGLNLPPEEIDGFAELFELYVMLCRTKGDRLWGYVELDQGGRENKIRTRAKLETMGLNPIPVYHPFGDGWDYFDYLAERYDRICFGNVVQASKAERIQLIHTMWQRRQKYPKLWIHVLGYTPDSFFYACPPNSADSSTWINSIRWPGGMPVRSMGKVVAHLDREFKYQFGSDMTGEVGMNKAAHVSALNAQSEMLNWNTCLERVSMLTGGSWR